jgi:uncharacterized delta-60 repeat protein
LRRVATVGVLFWCAIGSAGAIAAPADLDRSFGENGVVELPFDRSVTVTAADVASGPAGGAYVLRNRFRCGDICIQEPVLEHLLRDGSLDRAFNENGAAVASWGASGSSLAVTADGKLLVAMVSHLGRFARLIRLHPDGNLDASFGDGGGLIFAGGSAIEPDKGAGVTAIRFAIQKDERIVVAVDRGREAGAPRLELSRFLPDGARDPSFGGGTPLAVDLESSGLGIFADGGLVLAGNPCCFRPEPARVLRLLDDGSPDTAFGPAGMRRLNSVGEPITISTPIAQPNGRALVATSREGDPSSGLTLRGFRPAGGLDPTFGRGGKVSVSEGSSSLAADHRGRILLVGASQKKRSVPGGLMTLRRLRANGRVDRTFAGGQDVRLYRLPHTDAGPTTIGPDGRISVLIQRGFCARSCSEFHTYVARYLGGSSSARCLGKRATIVGTRRRDILQGTPHRDVIAALGGTDTVRGRGGSDLICGGDGGDSLLGGPGLDRVRQ